jgi:phage tail-like protein
VARSGWTDLLKNHYFWAFDASGIGGTPVFSPLFGFSSITAPSISLELETFKDGTYIYPRNVAKGATVGAITFQRAATLYDSDFYDWINLAIHGQTSDGSTPPVRRTIVVIQFTRINLASGSDATAIATAGAFAALLGASLVAGNGINVESAVTGAGVISAGALAGIGVGPIAYATRLPARAWILHGCLPVHYTASGELSANSPDVSIMSLEVQPEYIEELSINKAI